MGRSGRAGRRRVRRYLGATGTWPGHCSRRRLDPAGRLCGMGGRGNPAGPRRGVDNLVRTACSGVALDRRLGVLRGQTPYWASPMNLLWVLLILVSAVAI